MWCLDRTVSESLHVDLKWEQSIMPESTNFSVLNENKCFILYSSL